MSRHSIFVFIVVLTACAPRIKIRKVLLGAEAQFQDHIGLYVYDPQTHKVLADFNSNKYFTPASNTKIFTLFSCFQLIGDSIPSLKYVEKNDSLVFWGTGDPSFLYRNAFHNDKTYQFLATHPGKLYFSSSNFLQDHFGPGWAWDDYQYSYSVERSSFPMYGNYLTITDRLEGKVEVLPSLFKDSIKIFQTTNQKKKAVRAVGDNSMRFYNTADSSIFDREIPFHVSPRLITSLLGDTLNREVAYTDLSLPFGAKTLYSVPSDSLYKVMMQESDNFIAEQLLQLCAGIISDSLKSDIAIRYIKKNYLLDLPDEPQWVDGSGLSRYNLFTPRSIVKLWEKIWLQVPHERLFSLLATGGKSGTIRNSYQADPPYIYGKTGTLSNNHCISGYLLTKKGKVLIFSFMNNNYTSSTRTVRSKMEEVLYKIHEDN